MLKLYSYLYGLFGTDGNVRRTEDNHIYDLTLELIDEDIIDKINGVLPNCSKTERERDTNFKKNYHSYILHCHNQDFIQWCENNCFPIRNKTERLSLPIEYSEPDFWRGVIDGDGSIGLKNVEQQPFLSLATKSELLKEGFCDYIHKLTGFRPNVNRNKRDNIFNITLHGEKALLVLSDIYKDAEIYINRKYNSYLQIKDWKKQNLKGVKRLPWSKQETEDLLILPQEEFIKKYPTRTLCAIKAKKTKILKGGGDNVNK